MVYLKALLLLGLVIFGPSPVRCDEDPSSMGESSTSTTSEISTPNPKLVSPLEDRFTAGEALIVEVPGDTSSLVNGIYTIDRYGYIDLPIMGQVQVTNRSRYYVQEVIAKNMVNYTRDINIKVTPAIRIAFIGNFKEPGLYYIHPEKAVWDAFREAKVPLLEGQLQKMYLLRGTQRLPIHPLDLFSSGKTLREAGVQSGDIFALPEPPRRDGWEYFKDIAQIGTTFITATASIITLMILIENQSNNSN